MCSYNCRRTGSYVGISSVSSAKTALITKKKKAETDFKKVSFPSMTAPLPCTRSWERWR